LVFSKTSVLFFPLKLLPILERLATLLAYSVPPPDFGPISLKVRRHLKHLKCIPSFEQLTGLKSERLLKNALSETKLCEYLSELKAKTELSFLIPTNHLSLSIEYFIIPPQTEEKTYKN